MNQQSQSPPQHPRQTLSYLQQLFRERGIRPKNKLGQNFLIDINLVDLIERSAELTKADLAVEIGSGTGSLTARLINNAGAVLSVEIDPAFHSLVNELLGFRERVILIHSDVLKNKNQLHPRVLDALNTLRDRTGCGLLKLVSNLPYAVATPVITNFLLSDITFERMVVTVQWEIAEPLSWPNRAPKQFCRPWRCWCRASPMWSWCVTWADRYSFRGRKWNRPFCESGREPATTRCRDRSAWAASCVCTSLSARPVHAKTEEPARRPQRLAVGPPGQRGN